MKQTTDRLSARNTVSVLLNLLIVIFTCIGTFIMLTVKNGSAELTSAGAENLKYFTVLSNEFCGIVSLLWLIFRLRRKPFPVLPKLMAASAVMLTFVIVAAFLAPMYPDLNLYERSNLWFHLIVPVTGMAEFTLLETDKKIPVRYALLSALAALIYGIGYLVNILINGVGIWPDTNDWYGFLNWGYAVGIAIFAVIVIMNFGSALLLRGVNNAVNKKARGD